MNRYQDTFDTLRKNGKSALIAYTTLGFPNNDISLLASDMFVRAGANALELGLPFSDPVADGPLLQAAAHQALSNGFRFRDALSIIRELRQRHPDTPIGILAYANAAMAKGLNEFYSALADAGVDSVLLADVPVEESAPFQDAAEKAGIRPVYTVSTLTQAERLETIISKSDAFIYLLSRLGVTGTHEHPALHLADIISAIHQRTDLPICAGFGISRPDDALRMKASGADGAIIGSALVRIIEKHAANPDALETAIYSFLHPFTAIEKPQAE